jgi:hypothetical protein
MTSTGVNLEARLLLCLIALLFAQHVLADPEVLSSISLLDTRTEDLHAEWQYPLENIDPIDPHNTIVLEWKSNFKQPVITMVCVNASMNGTGWIGRLSLLSVVYRH